MTVKTLTLGELGAAWLIAAAAAFVIDFGIASLAAWLTKAPATFAPFTVLPIFAGCFAGALMACLAYLALQTFLKSDFRLVYLIVIGIALVASYHLPWRLTYSASPRFMGVTLPMQLALGLMHTVVAGLSAIALLAFSHQSLSQGE